jgi:hypothetical protein
MKKFFSSRLNGYVKRQAMITNSSEMQKQQCRGREKLADYTTKLLMLRMKRSR